MGTITVTEFVSMDGVMQAPGGEKFKYEGWTFEFDRGDDGRKCTGDELADAEAQLLGRVGRGFAGAWPEPMAWGADRRVAKRMNELPKYLVSCRSRARSGTTPASSTDPETSRQSSRSHGAGRRRRPRLRQPPPRPDPA